MIICLVLLEERRLLSCLNAFTDDNKMNTRLVLVLLAMITLTMAMDLRELWSRRYKNEKNDEGERYKDFPIMRDPDPCPACYYIPCCPPKLCYSWGCTESRG
ncbi:hypothetical protein ACROYT_G001897 [Oculina patagonica]